MAIVPVMLYANYLTSFVVMVTNAFRYLIVITRQKNRVLQNVNQTRTAIFRLCIEEPSTDLNRADNVNFGLAKLPISKWLNPFLY